MKYKLIIFDLDGTVLDTLNDLFCSVNRTMKLYSMPTRTLEEVRSFVGNGIGNLIARCVPDTTTDETLSLVTESFKEYYALHCNDSTRPYTGITELLRNLSASGVKCAVLSNKADSAVKTLCDIHFKGDFSVVRGETEEVRRKPCPDGFYQIMNSLGATKEDTLYIGDSEVDVESAKNAGIDLICVDWGFRSRDVLIKAGARQVAHSVFELERMISEK